MERMRAISIRADRQYIKALLAVAYHRGVTGGDLVRQALDDKYGREIQERLSFFEHGGARTQPTEPAPNTDAN